MSLTLNKYLLSILERKLRMDEARKSSIWLQTVGGDMVELESELDWFSPMLCHILNSGVGYSRGNPICLPPKVAPNALESIGDYFRFYQDPDRSDEECQLFDDEFLKKDTPTLCMLGHAAKCLQVEELVDMICDALARNIGNNSPEVKQGFMKYFDKCAKEQVLEPQKNLNCDLRIRLSNKLLAKQKKELKEVEDVKRAEAEVESQKHEDRSIEDLISFINGGDGDTKGFQTSKKKKSNRNKGKEKKKTSSSSSVSSSKAPALNTVIENHEEDIHASGFVNHSGSTTDSSNLLLGCQDESFNVEGDAVDNDLQDRAKMEEIDSDVEAFSLRLSRISCQKSRLVPLTDGIMSVIRTRHSFRDRK